MSIAYRRATIEDAPVIAQFSADMAMETENLALDRERVLSGAQAVLRDPSKGFYMLAVADGTVVGQSMITYEWSDWSNGMRWWVQSVYVRPEFRRRGIYRGLFGRLIKLAEEDGGVCAVRLYVHRSNQVAQAVYQKLGFADENYLVYGIELGRERD